jgi:hypothetical protein
VEARFEAGLQQGDVLGSWYDWLFARILMREATRVIEGSHPQTPASPPQN